MGDRPKIDVVGFSDDLRDVGAIAEILLGLANDDALHILTERGVHWLGSKLNEAFVQLEGRLNAEKSA